MTTSLTYLPNFDIKYLLIVQSHLLVSFYVPRAPKGCQREVRGRGVFKGLEVLIGEREGGNKGSRWGMPTTGG